MEYYLISLFVSIIIFLIIQYLDYNKSSSNPNEEEPYSLFKLSNALLFVIIYVVFTITFFYLNISNVKLLSFFGEEKGGNKNNEFVKDDIDPKVLSKINDNFDTGFAPFNSDDDGSSLSSISSASSE
jgi:hypothetical protein